MRPAVVGSGVPLFFFTAALLLSNIAEVHAQAPSQPPQEVSRTPPVAAQENTPWTATLGGSLGAGPPQQVIDLDGMPYGQPRPVGQPRSDDADDGLPNWDGDRSWQILPEGLIYHDYLAGEKESRLSGEWVHDQNRNLWMDSTLGGQVGLVRYGTVGPAGVQGWELDFEGSAQLRQDMNDDMHVDSVDFRAGVPLTYSIGAYQMKFAYYHISSHAGDWYLIEHPAYTRINFVRNALVWGNSYYLNPDFRIYGEVGWAFNEDGGTRPWEFQFGFDYAPHQATGSQGAPFLAANAHLRQEFNYSGNVEVQAGWAWRGHVGGPLARLGLVYYGGKSNQYQFYNQNEQQLGVGLWYDF